MRFVLLMTLVSFVNSNCALCFFSYLFFRKISFLWKHTKSTKLYHPSFEIHCKYEIATLVIFDFIFQWNPKVPNKLFIRFWETSIFDFSFEIWIWHVLLLTFFPKDFLPMKSQNPQNCHSQNCFTPSLNFNSNIR